MAETLIDALGQARQRAAARRATKMGAARRAYEGGMTFTEAAHVAGADPQTVKKWVHENGWRQGE